MTEDQRPGSAERGVRAVTGTRKYTARPSRRETIEPPKPRPAESGGRRRRRNSTDKATGGFWRETARLLKAGYYFLQREQARRAWFIFAVCVAAASLPFTSRWPELRQGAIVMASLAAGAVFLPELNSRIWRLSAKEIRDTIPEHRRRAFYTELISADCPENQWAQRWAILMWQRGVIPLLDAARDNRRIRWDMSYEVSVHLRQELKVAATRK